MGNSQLADSQDLDWFIEFFLYLEDIIHLNLTFPCSEAYNLRVLGYMCGMNEYGIRGLMVQMDYSI